MKKLPVSLFVQFQPFCCYHPRHGMLSVVCFGIGNILPKIKLTSGSKKETCPNIFLRKTEQTTSSKLQCGYENDNSLLHGSTGFSSGRTPSCSSCFLPGCVTTPPFWVSTSARWLQKSPRWASEMGLSMGEDFQLGWNIFTVIGHWELRAILFDFWTRRGFLSGAY